MEDAGGRDQALVSAVHLVHSCSLCRSTLWVREGNKSKKQRQKDGQRKRKKRETVRDKKERDKKKRERTERQYVAKLCECVRKEGS